MNFPIWIFQFRGIKRRNSIYKKLNRIFSYIVDVAKDGREEKINKEMRVLYFFLFLSSIIW